MISFFPLIPLTITQQDIAQVLACSSLNKTWWTCWLFYVIRYHNEAFGCLGGIKMNRQILFSWIEVHFPCRSSRYHSRWKHLHTAVQFIRRNVEQKKETAASFLVHFDWFNVLILFWYYFNVLFSVSFCHTLSGNIASAVEELEALYTQNPDGPQKSIAFVFRKVLEANNGAALDKCKPCNHSYLEDTVACERWTWRHRALRFIWHHCAQCTVINCTGFACLN